VKGKDWSNGEAHLNACWKLLLQHRTEVEDAKWQLFKQWFHLVLGYAEGNASVCRIMERVSAWWYQVLKDVIRAKKVAYNTWLQNKAESSLHSRYADEQKYAAQADERSKTQSGENFGRRLCLELPASHPTSSRQKIQCC